MARVVPRELLLLHDNTTTQTAKRTEPLQIRKMHKPRANGVAVNIAVIV
jgi:hypothetical protein